MPTTTVWKGCKLFSEYEPPIILGRVLGALIGATKQYEYCVQEDSCSLCLGHRLSVRWVLFIYLGVR